MKSLQTPSAQPGPWQSRHSRATIAVLFLLAVSGLSADQFVWTTKTPNSLVRFEAVGGAAGSKLYQFSGYCTLRPKILATTQCDAYDPTTDTWTSLPSIPQAVTHCGQVADTDNPNNQIFWLVGGFLGDHPGPTTNQVWKYSINNRTWAAGPPLPAPRAGGALVKLGRELHYFGGTIRNGSTWTDYGTHWAFDLDNGTAWRATTPDGQQLLAPMPNPRNHMGGVEFNGKIYAIGGQHKGQQSTAPQDEVDVYDPATNTWTQAAPMPRPIGHVTANVFVRNGHIVVVSGLTTNSVPIANVIEYDPSTNTWSELPPLPSGRQSPVSGLIGDQIVATCGLNGSLQGQTWLTTSTSTPGTWQTGPPLPIATSEVSTGVINGVLYLVGGGTTSTLAATLAYDLNTGLWRSDLAPRQYLGDHHAAEVINGKLYLFGGLNVYGPNVAAGKVQIYNPVTNSWSLGASMPWAAGSVSTAYIKGKVYAAGGIVGQNTVDMAAAYDPAANTWTPIASMPVGRNHTAAGTDGQKLYIFGGRTGRNATTIGFNDVQIYDPVSNAWQWSGQPGSTIPPLPQARGGMGKAAHYGNEFYVMGGETTNQGTGQVAGNVYNRVDVYNPFSKTWRLETPMPTARHGIFPVVGDGKILVAGGGVHSSISSSKVFEVFSTSSSPTPTPLAAPSDLTATAVSSSRINLAWTDNSTNEIGFRIYRSTDGRNFQKIANVGANITTYADTGLAAATMYYYRVRAYTFANASPPSNTASATTQP
jgi:N-acetylneuraminic acid mutarotase